MAKANIEITEAAAQHAPVSNLPNAICDVRMYRFEARVNL
jgi:hypothetical protein